MTQPASADKELLERLQKAGNPPVRSRPIGRGVLQAPLDRSTIDKAAPWLRLFAGAALIAWSSYTTITGVGEDFAPILRCQPTDGPNCSSLMFGLESTLVIGLLVAALLSLGEWLTSEHMPLLYCALLVLDARYTQMQIGPWISRLSAFHLETSPQWLPGVVSFILSWGLSLAIARYGEILLFGRRR